MAYVEVNEGRLEGEIVKNVLGGKYFSFKGIPYAKPPLGNLRFKAPEPPERWLGIRSAKEHGSNCIQFDPTISTDIFGSEDCLYINVYTPDSQPTKPLPVMVYIHGGGFTAGSGDSLFHGPDFLVHKDVIVATFNYRLGVLGFLSLETKDIPGNAGMKDQVAALRWVKKNIRSFGGDPSNVTIFGESAGGASVAFHLVSPLSEGLFQRAIVQSGAHTCSWAITTEPRQRAISLARQLGMNTDDDVKLNTFFMNQPAQNLVKLKVPLTFAEKHQQKLKINFAVVSENKFENIENFFTGDIFDVTRSCFNDNVEVIIGYTADEGLLEFVENPLDSKLAAANEYLEYFVPAEIASRLPIPKLLEVGKKIKKFYFGNEIISRDNIESLLKFCTMEYFVYGIMQLAKISASKKKKNIYVYKLNFTSERNIFGGRYMQRELFIKRKTVCHVDDLMYIFNNHLLDEPLDPESKGFGMIDTMTKLWTNFAKFGNPTPNTYPDVKWLPYTLESEFYLDIDDNLKIQSCPNKEEIYFWEQIFTTYLPSHRYKELL